MKNIYFTVAGMHHHYGQDFMKPDMKVSLVKEPDNEADNEAIRVELEGLGMIGYVANSVYTRLGESMSAGRIYDRIGDTAQGTVCYVLPKGVVARLDPQPETEAE